MLINKLKYLQGYVKVRLCGYAPERFLNLCSNHNILIWNLEYQKEQYEFCISVRGMKHLKAILKKTRTKIVILERHGLPFLLHRYRKRKLFACGVLVCCGLLYAMSLFVWKVEINGNMHRTDSTVLKFLEQNQVYHGLLKSKVNCEAIEELLRAGYDDVIWASAKLEGTMLVIELQENLSTNEQAVTQSLEDGTPKDIVANKDTTIQSIFTRQGIPLVEQGTLVKEGDVLVEGKIPVMNDSGEVASYQYCVSDADIMGVTQYGYADRFPMIYEAKDFTGNQRKIYGVRLFQTQKNIPVFTKKFKEYDCITNEYDLKIGENFYLPVIGVLETQMEYQVIEKKYEKEEAQQLAEKKLNEFCEKLTQKGVQIIENNVMIVTEENQCSASGMLTVIEPIGSKQDTILSDAPNENGKGL